MGACLSADAADTNTANPGAAAAATAASAVKEMKEAKDAKRDLDKAKKALETAKTAKAAEEEITLKEEEVKKCQAVFDKEQKEAEDALKKLSEEKKAKEAAEKAKVEAEAKAKADKEALETIPTGGAWPIEKTNRSQKLSIKGKEQRLLVLVEGEINYFKMEYAIKDYKFPYIQDGALPQNDVNGGVRGAKCDYDAGSKTTVRIVPAKTSDTDQKDLVADFGNEADAASFLKCFNAHAKFYK